MKYSETVYCKKCGTKINSPLTLREDGSNKKSCSNNKCGAVNTFYFNNDGTITQTTNEQNYSVALTGGFFYFSQYPLAAFFLFVKYAISSISCTDKPN